MSFVLKYFDIFEGLNKTALHQCIDLLCATNACVTYIILQLLENADCCFASYYAFMIDAYLNDTGLWVALYFIVVQKLLNISMNISNGEETIRCVKVIFSQSHGFLATIRVDERYSPKAIIFVNLLIFTMLKWTLKFSVNLFLNYNIIPKPQFKLF